MKTVLLLGCMALSALLVNTLCSGPYETSDSGYPYELFSVTQYNGTSRYYVFDKSTGTIINSQNPDYVAGNPLYGSAVNTPEESLYSIVPDPKTGGSYIINQKTGKAVMFNKFGTKISILTGE